MSHISHTDTEIIHWSFALTAVAGFSSMLGGAVFLTDKFIHLASPRNFSIALSFSSGVMIATSLMVLQIEAIRTIRNSAASIKKVHNEDGHNGHMTHGNQASQGGNQDMLCDRSCEGLANLICAFSFGAGCATIILLKGILSKLWITISNNAQSENLEEGRNTSAQSLHESPNSISPNSVPYLEDEPSSPTTNKNQDSKNKIKFHSTSFITAIFLGLNNIPNGFAIYLASVNDFQLGVVLTIAIALYNAPEGICIATPIFYSTGNLMKSFIWTIPIAFASPIGGGIAYLTLGCKRGTIAEGIMFAVVAGMMVTNSIQELLPTARQFSPDKNYVTFSFMFGIFSIMIVVASFVYMGI